MNTLGVMVDLAHAGRNTSLDIIDYSKDPVLISHTACNALFDPVRDSHYVEQVLAQNYAKGVSKKEKPNSRNAEDDIIKYFAQNDRLIFIYAIGYMLGDESLGCSFGTFANHLEHAIKIAGIDHVGIGTDRSFIPSWEPDAMAWTNWPYFTLGLVCRLSWLQR